MLNNNCTIEILTKKSEGELKVEMAIEVKYILIQPNGVVLIDIGHKDRFEALNERMKKQLKTIFPWYARFGESMIEFQINPGYYLKTESLRQNYENYLKDQEAERNRKLLEKKSKEDV